MNTTLTPRQAVTHTEVNPQLASGTDERFTGYGVMGVPFSDGHYLAFRDMLASSLGTPYRAVWHRDPAGHWTIYTTADPDVSCPRYFGSAATAEKVPAIDVSWRDGWNVDVTMGTRLSWHLEFQTTAATKAMSAMGGAMPATAWNSDAVLASMGPMAGAFLRAGRVRLHGRTPNRQNFKAIPLQVWRVVGGDARLDGADMGPLGPLGEQTRLGDFWLPQRGLFFVGQARFTAGASESSAARSGDRSMAAPVAGSGART